MTDPNRCRRAVEGKAELPWSQECSPTYTLDRQVAEARQSMGEDRWRELNQAWEIAS